MFRPNYPSNEWDWPSNGVIFHWAPGSRWEMHTVAPFKHAIHHIAEEHNWVDTMFSDVFALTAAEEELTEDEIDGTEETSAPAPAPQEND